MMFELTHNSSALIARHSVTECLSIGGVSLALAGESSDEVRIIRDADLFRSSCEEADIEIKVEWADDLQPWPGEKLFDSGFVWALYQEGSEFIFDFTSYPLVPRPYKRLRVSSNFHSGQLTLNRTALERYAPVCPLEYPADELLFTNYLARGVGVEVHGCGLIDREIGGQLLLGHSGAGKSTTAHLWKSYRDSEILSDDRIILRLYRGAVWMYGTPWHGEAGFASPKKARLRRIFLLAHGRENEVLALPKARVVGELFARCFPPFYSASGLANTIDFLNQVVNLVPCYEFRFTPDVSAVKAVLAFHD